MAQKTIINLIDDIDGSEAIETVVFGLDGATYEIDLNDVHAADLREVLAPFISVARRVGQRSSGRSTGASSRRDKPANTATDGVDPKAVRAWAVENGVEVNPRGRIKADVVEAYETANK